MTIGESSMFSIPKFGAMGIMLLSLGCAALLADEPTAPAISLAAFGPRILTHDTQGDTWDGAWLADGRVLLQYDDGSGWGKTGEKGKRLRSRGIRELLTKRGHKRGQSEHMIITKRGQSEHLIIMILTRS